MGMGEPPHNLRRVLSSINFLAKYSGISYKNLVLSTVGTEGFSMPLWPLKLSRL